MAPQTREDAHVVGDLAERTNENVGKFDRARGLTAFPQAAQDPTPQRVGDRKEHVAPLRVPAFACHPATPPARVLIPE